MASKKKGTKKKSGEKKAPKKITWTQWRAKSLAEQLEISKAWLNAVVAKPIYVEITNLEDLIRYKDTDGFVTTKKPTDNVLYLAGTLDVSNMSERTIIEYYEAGNGLI